MKYYAYVMITICVPIPWPGNSLCFQSVSAVLSTSTKFTLNNVSYLCLMHIIAIQQSKNCFSLNTGCAKTIIADCTGLSIHNKTFLRAYTLQFPSAFKFVAIVFYMNGFSCL